MNLGLSFNALSNSSITIPSSSNGIPITCALYEQNAPRLPTNTGSSVNIMSLGSSINLATMFITCVEPVVMMTLFLVISKPCASDTFLISSISNPRPSVVPYCKPISIILRGTTCTISRTSSIGNKSSPGIPPAKEIILGLATTRNIARIGLGRKASTFLESLIIDCVLSISY